MAGLAKGLEVIEAFGGRHAEMTVADAARVTGTSRAAARRCLLTLTELGYLAHDGKFFRPTPRLGRLGTSSLEATPIAVLARPYVTAARDALGESVSLAVLDDGWTVFVARADSERIVSAGIRVGTRLPAHCSATGRVLLAALPDEEVEAYLRDREFVPRTDKTLVDPVAIRREIRSVREAGVSFVDEELELGLRALAVPVRASDGRTLAAFSISTSTAQATLEEMQQRILPVARDYADQLGRML
jgi:IclR family pca regulon transcriptional regulator